MGPYRSKVKANPDIFGTYVLSNNFYKTNQTYLTFSVLNLNSNKLNVPTFIVSVSIICHQFKTYNDSNWAFKGSHIYE